MPLDHRRINGPEASHSYKLYSKQYLVALENQLIRSDRGNEEPRKICKSLSSPDYPILTIISVTFQLLKAVFYPTLEDLLISNSETPKSLSPFLIPGKFQRITNIAKRVIYIAILSLVHSLALNVNHHNRMPKKNLMLWR